MAEKEGQAAKTPEPQAKKQEKKAGALSGILAVLIALLVVAVVFCGVFYMVLKNNVFGLGEAYRPAFQSHPILKFALPPVPPAYDADDPKNLTQEEIVEKYGEYRQKVADLNRQLEESKSKISQMEKDAGDLAANQKVLDDNQKALQAIEEQQKKLEDINTQLAQLLAEGDREGFKAYFAQLDKAAAAAIYEELLKEDLDLETKTAIAKPFSVMEPASAAKVLTELWSKDRTIMISIMEGLKPQAAALIMEKMDASVAAEVMRVLADKKLGRKQE